MRRVERLPILRAVAGCLLAGLAFSPAKAVLVEIGAGPVGNGCTVCYNGPTQLHYGQVVTLTNDGTGPDQITLAAGTYSITNAAPTGFYSGWRVDGGSDWAWSFIFGSDNGDGTATVLDYGYVYGLYSSQAALAGATNIGTYDINGVIDPAGSTVGYATTFTLAKTTTLDFFVDDGYLGDNTGGVALSIKPLAASAVPEPASWTMMMTGFGAIGSAVRRRRPVPA